MSSRKRKPRLVAARSKMDAILAAVTPLAKESMKNVAKIKPSAHSRGLDVVHATTVRSLERVSARLRDMRLNKYTFKGNLESKATKAKPTSPKMFSKIVRTWLAGQPLTHLGADDENTTQSDDDGTGGGGRGTSSEAAKAAQQSKARQNFLIGADSMASKVPTMPGILFSHRITSKATGIGIVPSVHVQVLVAAGSDDAPIVRCLHRASTPHGSAHVKAIAGKVDVTLFDHFMGASTDFCAWSLPPDDDDESKSSTGKLGATSAGRARGDHKPSPRPAAKPATKQAFSPKTKRADFDSPSHHHDATACIYTHSLYSPSNTFSVEPASGERAAITTVYRRASRIAEDRCTHESRKSLGDIAGCCLLQAIPKYAPFPAARVGEEENYLIRAWYLRVTWTSPGIIAAAVVFSKQRSAPIVENAHAEVKPIDVHSDWVTEPTQFVSRAVDGFHFAFHKAVARRISFDFVQTQTNAWYFRGLGPVECSCPVSSALSALDVNAVKFGTVEDVETSVDRSAGASRAARTGTKNGRRSHRKSASMSKFHKLRALPTRASEPAAPASRPKRPPIHRAVKSLGSDTKQPDTCLLCGLGTAVCTCWN